MRGRRGAGAAPRVKRDPETPERAEFHDFLARHDRFLLTTHVNPDGDAIGSEVAFARMLAALGKQVRVLNDSPTPPAFAWLEVGLAADVYTEAIVEQRVIEACALSVLDNG